MYKKAAEQGNAYAQDLLAQTYEYGNGVSIDRNKSNELYRTAAQWFIKAAELGDSAAQAKLGYYYEKGHGVAPDQKKAVELYTKAAAQGNADGQFELGRSYSSGNVVSKDQKKAVELYTKAAMQEHSTAQYYLGDCYQYGDGVPKNDDKAMEWYSKSAGEEIAAAQTPSEQIAQWEQDEKDTLTKRLNSYIDTPKGKVFAPQGLFNMFHPVGKATKVVVHDVTLKVDEKDFKRGKFTPVSEINRMTVYWEGPVEKNGYTKLQWSYDIESRKTIGWKILSTNGMTTGEATEAGAAIGVTIHELFK
jgi:TPR repeat protein